jgi:beta-galactosidase GanA
MVGFPVKNTLSESGTVSRGVCQKDSNGYLTSIVEHTKIEENGGVIVNHNDDGTDTIVTPETPVSMNMWGFTPDYFKYSEDFFREFLKENEKSLKAEFYIPTMVDHLIKTGEAKVKVLSTSSKWFGVTYAADKPTVLLQINSLISKGKYPKKLWE